MSVILVLIAFSVSIAVVFLFAFFWSVKNGQYDDTYGSSVRILFEDDVPDNSPDDDATIGPPANEPSPNQ